MVLLIEIIRKTKYERILSLIMLLIYIVGLVYFTMLRGGRTNLGGFAFRFPPPFLQAMLKRQYYPNTNRSVLNMLLFVPLGCLLPYNISLWKNETNSNRLQFRTAILIGLCVSLAIETSQLIFKVGVFEIDDLVKNTMGTGLGYVFNMILSRRSFENDE